MELFLIIGVILLLVVLPLYNGIVQEKKNIKALRRKLKEAYGEANSRKWRSGEIEIISRYTFLREDEGIVDELTWNDLNMDEIFMQMAYTGSSVGDDCLYKLLHYPRKNEQELQRLEEKISYYRKNEEARLNLWVLFHRMGRMKNISLSQYLQYMSELTPEGNAKHHLVNLLILLSLFLMIFSVGYGLILLFLFLLYNLYTYFKYRGEMEPYLVSFRYILSMLNYSGKMEKDLAAEWKDEKEILNKAWKLNERLSKNSFLVMSSGRMSGDGIELLLDYLRMCFHLDIIKFNSMLRHMQTHMDALWEIYELLGGLDSCLAIGAYREWLPAVCNPEFCDVKEINMEEVYHPLVENAVANSLHMKKNILLTGSNASGKSTFLKTVAVNILLAQTVNTCTAKAFRLPFSRLFTAISLQDSLRKKESYYMAEIRAVKRILDHAADGEQVVCMVDEMLRGTNTRERIAASTGILKEMVRRGVLCIVATHDGELTQTLREEYENYHFEEEFSEGEICFSYRLKPSVAKSSNAIRLLEQMGYPPEVVGESRWMMQEFERKGTWQ